MNIYELSEKLSFVYDPVNFSKETTALVLIDIQKLASPDFVEYEAKELLKLPKEEYQDALNEYTERFNRTVQNAKKILNACREKGIRPIHVKIEAQTLDGVDTCPLHKAGGMVIPKDSFFGQFCEETAPIDNEIVLTKTCSGAHVGTNINRVLTYIGIKEVIVVGFYTDQCVTTSARALADLGYITTVVEDATGAFTPKLHEEALSHIVNLYVRGGKTEEIVDRINKL